MRFDGRLDTDAGNGAVTDRFAGLEVRLLLPAGHVFDRPGSGLTREREVELEQGAELACLFRGWRPENVLHGKNAARAQGAGHPASQFTVLLVREMVYEHGDENQVVGVFAQVGGEGVPGPVHHPISHPFGGQDRRGLGNRLGQIEDHRPQTLVLAAQDHRVVAVGATDVEHGTGTLGHFERRTNSPAEEGAIARIPRW